jgi:hypothetical protein
MLVLTPDGLSLVKSVMVLTYVIVDPLYVFVSKLRAESNSAYFSIANPGGSLIRLRSTSLAASVRISTKKHHVCDSSMGSHQVSDSAKQAQDPSMHMIK